jgi:hypothetical protein
MMKKFFIIMAVAISFNFVVPTNVFAQFLTRFLENERALSEVVFMYLATKAQYLGNEGMKNDPLWTSLRHRGIFQNFEIEKDLEQAKIAADKIEEIALNGNKEAQTAMFDLCRYVYKNDKDKILFWAEKAEKEADENNLSALELLCDLENLVGRTERVGTLKSKALRKVEEMAGEGILEAQLFLCDYYYNDNNKDMDNYLKWCDITLDNKELNWLGDGGETRGRLQETREMNISSSQGLTVDEYNIEQLKKKALNGRNQYDYWIIGHMYEFGEGNDNAKITINLDSALVWYQKAAEIDPKNKEYVTAVQYKIKTGGGDYWDHKKETQQKAAYDELCRQFGKKYVDAAGNGQIIVGMPEKLMVATFNAKLYGQSGNSKTYRIYGYGSRERLDGSIYVSGDHHLMTVWVSGGKVTSFKKWE